MAHEVNQLLDALLTRQISRRSFIVKATALGLSTATIGAFLEACGGGATTPEATQPAGVPTTAPAGGATPAPQATAAGTTTAGGATKGKLLRWSEASPCYIDPAVGSSFASSVSLLNLYDSLVFPNDDGTVKPWLASKWDVSADGLKYTFTLNKGVKFHNGDDLTADDVVFSMERLMAIGEGYGYLFNTTVDKATAVDPTTVEFAMKKPFGPFISALVRLYVLNKKQITANIDKTGQSQYGDNGDYGKKWLLQNDAGSGPYTTTEVKVEESITAQRYAGYWQPLAAENPDGWKYYGTTEGATIRTLFSSKQLDITDQWQTNEAFDAFAKMQGVELTEFPGNVMNVMLHNRKAPTDDINFRKALTYAVDYDQAAQIFRATPPRGPIQYDLPGFDDSIQPFKRDVEKSKQFLAQSKYANQPDALTMDLAWVAEVPDEEKLALLIQANCQEVGIKVNVIKIPWNKAIEEAATPETTPNALTIFVAPHYAEAGSIIESRYHSKSTGTWEQTEWLKDPEVDAMIEDAIGTSDQTERFQKYKALQAKIIDLAPSLWMFQSIERHAYWSQYLDWKTAATAKQTKKGNPVMGYNFFMPDIKMYPDKM